MAEKRCQILQDRFDATAKENKPINKRPKGSMSMEEKIPGLEGWDETT